MSIYSTVDYLHGLGFTEGREFGLREGACRQLVKLLVRHGSPTLGTPTGEQRAMLETASDRVALSELERLRDRLTHAASWPELLSLLGPLPERPANPHYLEPLDVDPTPMPPSIDTYAKATIMKGMDMVLHLRFQRLYQDDIGEVLYKESVRLKALYNCPVQTLVFLMWKGADGPGFTCSYRIPAGGVYQYKLMRLWEKDAAEMLNSVGTAMFAPLCKFPEETLPELLRDVEKIIETKGKDAAEKRNCWAVAYSSLGLKYPAERVNELLKHRMPEILEFHESKSVRSEGFYDGNTAGAEEGLQLACRDWVFALGRQRFRQEPGDLVEKLDQNKDLKAWELLAGRVLTVAGWQDLALG